MSAEETECDSRTASVGTSLRGSNNAATARKRSRKKQKAGRRDIQDFVPKGSSFTGTALEVNAGSHSSKDSDNSGEDSAAAQLDLSRPESPARAIQPAVNWNKRGKGTIRTTLRGQGLMAGIKNAMPSNSFHDINGTYWRSRSASVSSTEERETNPVHNATAEKPVDAANGSHTGDQEAPKNKHEYITIFSDEFDSGEVSEGNDDIVLNLASQNQSMGANQSHPTVQTSHGTSQPTLSDRNGAQSSAPSSQAEPANNVGGSRADTQALRRVFGQHGFSAEQDLAFQEFYSRYSSNPLTLADLSSEDLASQTRYFFYNGKTEQVDLNSPVRCVECMQEGHLADICPSKQCEHCGAWASHESRFCPSWQRCQRCRERGHDKDHCASPLQASPSEQPCDLCGSEEHVESNCDLIWKYPKQTFDAGPIFISISCCYCLSNQHLLGDCPKRPFRMNSSSWTLRKYEPSMISNVSSLPYTGVGFKGGERHVAGYKIKCRADERSSSPESEGSLIPRNQWTSINRPPQQPPRRNIRISSSIGRGSAASNGPPRHEDLVSERFVPHDYRRNYRDRDDFFGHNTRQRSLSPVRNPPSRRGGGNRRPPLPRSPPRSPPSRSRGRGASHDKPRGRGGSNARGRDPRPQRDSYQPMPSAGKAAWSRFRS